MAIEPQSTHVSSSEVEAAWDNWLKFHHMVDCDEVLERFFTYIHTLEQSHGEDSVDWIEDGPYHVCGSTAQHIQQAAGPYFHAVFTAYYAKYGYGGRK